jgi:hypothetical protein
MLVIADITCNDSAYYLVVSSNPTQRGVLNRSLLYNAYSAITSNTE